MAYWQDIKEGSNPFISATKILEVVALAGKVELKEDRGMQFWLQTMIPTIVMKSFSCELILKAILAHEGIAFGKIHKLNDLFNLLSDSDSSTSNSKRIKTDIQSRVITKLEKIINDQEISWFNNALDDAANIFVDWRYFFESKSNGTDLTAPISFLDELFKALEEQKILLN